MEQLLPGTGRFLFCSRLDDDTYPNAIQVSDQQLAAVQLTGDAFHPESNSTINPSVINARTLTTLCVRVGVLDRVDGGGGHISRRGLRTNARFPESSRR